MGLRFSRPPIPNVDERARPEPDLSSFHRAFRLAEAGDRAGIAELKRLADEGSLLSMVHIGDAYQQGRVVGVDLAEAESYYRRAANSGSLLAHFFLGWLLQKQKRVDEGMRYLNYASGRGYAPATALLGRLYIAGRGVTQDVPRGELLLRRAIKQGSVGAKVTLSVSLLKYKPSLRRVTAGIILRVIGVLEAAVVLLAEGNRTDRLR